MKIGIIGYGIVGAVLAYTLSKHSEHEVHVYDRDTYQGTKNAVGIICPWVSQRRNKVWYAHAKDGAAFIPVLARELSDSSFMTQNGVLIYHNHLNRFYDIARTQAETELIMGTPQLVPKDYLNQCLPDYMKYPDKALHIPGGYQIDGAQLLSVLREKSRIAFYPEIATLENKTTINGQMFDCVCVCAGGYTSQVLHDYHVDSRMQKGMLAVMDARYPALQHQPVIMPQGEIDILNRNGQIVIGASHQNVFDSFAIEQPVIAGLLDQARHYIPSIDDAHIERVLVGTRSVSKDNTPYISSIGNQLYVIAGLGSSGLTTGPLLAHKLAQYIMRQNDDSSIFDHTRIFEKQT